VRTVKSITAWERWEQHEPFFREYLWGGGFWEESHHVETAGDASTDTIEQYIQHTEHAFVFSQFAISCCVAVASLSWRMGRS